jgi:signal transduction histidine kinase
MNIPWRKYLLSTSRRRAAIEGSIVSLVAALFFLATSHGASPPSSSSDITPYITPSFAAAMAIAGVPWYVARARISDGWNWRDSLLDGVFGGLLGVPSGTILVFVLDIILSGMPHVFVVDGMSPRDVFALATSFLAGSVLAMLIGFALEAMFLRGCIHLMRFWNRLRSEHLIWAFTHAQLAVAAALGAAFTVLMSALIFVASDGRPLSAISIAVVIGILSAISVLIIFPPALFGSFIFTRPVTKRLLALKDATTSLKDGEYGIRVPVEGADEVAQLQTNFNAMASDLERAVREVEAERDNVSKVLDSRRQLVASVSHELRTPIATVRAYLESTREHWDESTPEPVRHDLDVMEHEIIRLQGLIDDLFTLSRADVGRLDIRLTDVDVAQVTRDVTQQVAQLAWNSKRVEVVAEIPMEMNAARADTRRLEQILHNLLNNAVRHTAPGGIVAVSASEEGDQIVLRVRDTGEGIPADELPHIWERFYRTEHARDEGMVGTGLGLAIVKDMTEAMGGSVEAESVLGEGSSFTVRLPRTVAGASGKMRAIPAPAPTEDVAPASAPASAAS